MSSLSLTLAASERLDYGCRILEASSDGIDASSLNF